MKAILLTFMLMLMLILTGCLLYTPSFRHQVISGKEIQAEDVSFMQMGQTRRDELIKTFGEPWADYRDLGVIVYFWETKQGDWIIGMALPSGSAGGTGEVTRLHYLFVQLDDRDRVQRYDFIKASKKVPTKDQAIQWLQTKTQPRER